MNKTNTTMAKSGFSLMELLIVMVILAGLATMIIPNMSSGTEAAKLTSMRNDARTAISTLQAKYIDSQDYTSVIGGSALTLTDGDDDGLADTALADTTVLQLSAGNSITVEATSSDCYTISVGNSQVSEKTIDYDSCNSGKIQLVNSGS